MLVKARDSPWVLYESNQEVQDPSSRGVQGFSGVE